MSPQAYAPHQQPSQLQAYASARGMPLCRARFRSPLLLR
jgi:hypothetical protein